MKIIRGLVIGVQHKAPLGVHLEDAQAIVRDLEPNLLNPGIGEDDLADSLSGTAPSKTSPSDSAPSVSFFLPNSPQFPSEVRADHNHAKRKIGLGVRRAAPGQSGG